MVNNIKEGKIKLGDIEVYAQNIRVISPDYEEAFISEEKIIQVDISPEPFEIEFECSITRKDPERISKFESLKKKTVLATTSSDFMRPMYVRVKWEYEIASGPSYARYTVKLKEDTLTELPKNMINESTKQTTVKKDVINPKGVGRHWIRW